MTHFTFYSYRQPFVSIGIYSRNDLGEECGGGGGGGGHWQIAGHRQIFINIKTRVGGAEKSIIRGGAVPHSCYSYEYTYFFI